MDDFIMAFRKIKFLFIAVLLFSSPFFAGAESATSNADLQALIKKLQAQIQSLEAKVVDLQTQVQSVKTELKFSRALARGTAGDDVRQLQEFLKTFPDVYPEGLVTGYFGPLTEAAIKRFQERQGVINLGSPETTGFGQVGPKTISKINELLGAGTGASGITPPGLVTAPGIEKKVATTTAPGIVFPTPTPSVAAATTSAVATTTTLPPPSSEERGGLPSTPPPPPQTTVPAAPPATTPATSTISTPPPPPAPPIAVISPNGGETWEYNSGHRIDYKLNGVSRIGFKLFKSSQLIFTTSDTNSRPITNGLSIFYLFNNQDPKAGWGSDYKVRIYDWDHPEVYDESNNYFTIAQADTMPPVVSSVLASSITSNLAVITWTTDEPARDFVNYGSVKSGPGADWAVTAQNTSWESYVTSHSVALSNLKSGTLYTYRVYNIDKYGNSAVLSTGYPPEYTFTTTGMATSSTATSTALETRARNLAAIKNALESLRAIIEGLSQRAQ